MNKRKNKIMIIISIIIIIIGLTCGFSMYHDITNQVSKNDKLYVDGSDFSFFIFLFGEAAAIVLSMMTVLTSVIIVILQWIVYLIIRIIQNKILKKNNPEMYIHSHENI